MKNNKKILVTGLVLALMVVLPLSISYGQSLTPEAVRIFTPQLAQATTRLNTLIELEQARRQSENAMFTQLAVTLNALGHELIVSGDSALTATRRADIGRQLQSVSLLVTNTQVRRSTWLASMDAITKTMSQIVRIMTGVA